MNKLRNILTAAALLIAGSASAATWNDAAGMGAQGDTLFSGSGVSLAVIQSVQSNALYYIASARGDGTPRVTDVLTKTDLTGYNLDFLVGTNVWTCASNQPAGTNIIWLTSTNSMMATNDFLVLRNIGSDAHQLLVVSGNATDATGLVYTNSSGYVGIKVFTTPTNTITAGDLVYKMTRLFRMNPLSDHAVTNKLISPWANWLTPFDPLATGTKISVSGRAGWPLVVMQGVSNSAGLYVTGEYYRRPRF